MKQCACKQCKQEIKSLVASGDVEQVKAEAKEVFGVMLNDEYAAALIRFVREVTRVPGE